MSSGQIAALKAAICFGIPLLALAISCGWLPILFGIVFATIFVGWMVLVDRLVDWLTRS